MAANWVYGLGVAVVGGAVLWNKKRRLEREVNLTVQAMDYQYGGSTTLAYLDGADVSHTVYEYGGKWKYKNTDEDVPGNICRALDKLKLEHLAKQKERLNIKVIRVGEKDAG
jgi:hypothetical protein